jgi:glycosyltransferase involved in cell wall biosynthesis
LLQRALSGRTMRVLWVAYGSLEKLSGGNLYDRLVVEYLRAQGVRVEVLGLPRPPYLLGPLRAPPPQLRPEEGLDAVVVDELVHPSLFRWAAARARDSRRRPPAHPHVGRSRTARPRLVTLVHHLRSREPPPSPWRAFARAMERRLLACSDAVIANSRITAATVRELAGDVPVAVCPPGCDRLDSPSPGGSAGLADGPGAAAAADRDASAGSERASCQGPVRLLATGNLVPRKGYDLLLRILAGMTDLPWVLRVSGRPVDRRYARRLGALARREGLDGRVTFTGELETDLLAREYRRAQVFVFPSRYEGYGISLAEAVFAGLPFVAFAGGAVAEAVRGRGLLASPGDLGGFAAGLRRLIADEAFRERQAAVSRELAPSLPRWRDTGRGFLAALEQACG